MKYKWILFDADGTLFDFDTAAVNALRNCFAQFGHRFEDHYLEIYERINLQFWRDLEAGLVSPTELRSKRFEQLFEAIGITCDAHGFGDQYLKNLSDNSDLYDGAEEVVKQLAGNAKLMMITNGLQEVQRPRFARAAIKAYFEDFVISEEVGSAKPHAAIFDAAFALMGQPDKSEVLIVGDSLSSDIQGGHNYGIDTCWYNPQGKARNGAAAAQYEIASLSELLALPPKSETASG